MSDGNKSRRGFSGMTADRQREIASLGGQSVAPENRSFSRDPQMAKESGRKGGLAVSKENRSFTRNPELAREAGRKGGLARSKALKGQT